MIHQIIKNFIAKKEALPLSELMVDASPEDVLIGEFREKIDSVFSRSLRIRQVDAGSCNACEWECIALTNPIYDVQRFGVDFVASPRHADVLLVTGPVSRQMEPALRKTWIATPEPRIVIACGDCAVDGGIYRGSYAVADGVDNVIPVDCRIPGCPPSPARLIRALIRIMNRLSKK